MKKLLTLILFGAGVCSVQALTPVGGDDFNDNTVDPAWVPLFTSSGVAFSEINQRLEFTGTDGFVGWNWTDDTLSTTQDWAIAIDLAYSIEPGSLASGQDTSLQLEIEAGGTDGFQMKFFIEDSGFYLLTQYGDYVTDIGYALDYRSIPTNQITVRVDYDASTEMMSASYDDGSGFTTTTNYSISSWELSPGSTFLPLVSVDHESIPFASGDAYFDNFQVYGGDAQPVAEEDDFNDDSIDPAKWALLHIDGAAIFSENNQRLEFTSPDTANSFVEWKWNGSTLSYTQDWSAAVDVSILYDALELTGKDIEIGLAALEGAGYWFNLAFNMDEFGPSLGTYAGDPLDNDLLNGWGGFITTNALTLKIAFDSTTKELRSSYSIGGGFVSLTNFYVGAFGLTDASTFYPTLLVEGGTVAVTPGKVYFDNFKITRGSKVVDDDDDGLPDEWEIQYWGSIGHPDANPDADPDADGLGYGGPGRNWAEWVMGTDPTNANSILKLAQPREILGEGFVIDWQSVSGRVYNVQWTEELSAGFQTLETGITHPQNSYTDTVHTAKDGGFYNLKVELEN